MILVFQRLIDIAQSLLKASPYDPETMGCTGLQRYMNQILPFTDWSNEAMRPALTTLLRRVEKTFTKIYKKPSIRVSNLHAWRKRSDVRNQAFKAIKTIEIW